MCDFHSTAWRLLGQEIQCAHLPSNSHSESIEAAGWRVNEPNRTPFIFEAEWNGIGELPSDWGLIRNSGECPEKLTKRIRDHYAKLRDAISGGNHLTTYFSDVKKWHDVWSRAIENKVPVTLPSVFPGSIVLREGATLQADALTEVSGYIYVREGATLTAPKLEKSSSIDVQEGAKLIAPKLKRKI